LVVLTVQCLARALDALVALLEEFGELCLGEVTLFGLDGFALAAVDGDEVPRDEVQLLAEPGALTADLPQGLPVVLPEVRPRLVIRPQRLSQPPQLHLAVGLLCQTTTRLEMGERAGDVKLQQTSRGVGRSSRGSGCGPLQAERREGEVVHKSVDETHGYCWSFYFHVTPLLSLPEFLVLLGLQ
jgi:hypothetical protein